MTETPGENKRRILCPTCLNEFDWDADSTLYERVEGVYSPIKAADDEPARLRRDRELDAWKRCPTAPNEGEQPHYLPVGYGRHGPPMVIGFVGNVNTGKSHLLATMVKEIARGGLEAVGARAEPLDNDEHDDFLGSYVNPLFETGRYVPPNPRLGDAETMFRDAFLITHGSSVRPVAFFDVSGEDLRLRHARSTHFMLAVDALVFVVDWDPQRLVREAEQALDEYTGAGARRAGPKRVGPTVLGDPAIELALRRLKIQDYGRDLPVAIAITKSDELRFTEPVMKWLRRPGLSAFRPATDPDLNLIWQESRDAYAFLHNREMSPWLLPYATFRRATLHFVSATGSASEPAEDEFGVPIERFVRGVRPQRILDPLVALLAMSGMFGTAAARVGSWPHPPEPSRHWSTP
jgi:hypothetical protein